MLVSQGMMDRSSWKKAAVVCLLASMSEDKIGLLNWNLEWHFTTWIINEQKKNNNNKKKNLKTPPAYVWVKGISDHFFFFFLLLFIYLFIYLFSYFAKLTLFNIQSSYFKGGWFWRLISCLALKNGKAEKILTRLQMWSKLVFWSGINTSWMPWRGF